MPLPKHRLIPLQDAIAEFDLEALYAHMDGDTLDDTFAGSRYDGDRDALVLDGDTCFDEDFSQINVRLDGANTPFQELIGRARIVVVNGNLDGGLIDTRECTALFVFGNVRCRTFHFYQFDLAWIAGDLSARRAILATADQDSATYAPSAGRAAYVRGRVFAPQVRSWFMHLGHLDWTGDSGSEFREDVEYAGQDHKWLADAVWCNR